MKELLYASTVWHPNNLQLPTALQVKSLRIDMKVAAPPGNSCARFAKQASRGLSLAMDLASLNPWREAGTLRWLSALLAPVTSDLVQYFTLKCRVYDSLVARVSKLAILAAAVTGPCHVSRRDRLRESLSVAMQTSCDVYTGGVRRPVPSEVSKE